MFTLEDTATGDNIKVYLQNNNFAARRQQNFFMNNIEQVFKVSSLPREQDKTKIKQVMKDEYLDFICENMWNHRSRDHVVDTLENHVSVTGLGVFFMSVPLDAMVTKIQFITSNYGLIRHFTEAFNYGFTQNWDLGAEYIYMQRDDQNQEHIVQVGGDSQEDLSGYDGSGGDDSSDEMPHPQNSGEEVQQKQKQDDIKIKVIEDTATE